ncbi:MAG: hypothetical protein KF832_26735 [Caldilineaceae bacterium]|nr:hypothetical protein [Caldilineaceae bacterium]
MSRRLLDRSRRGWQALRLGLGVGFRVAVCYGAAFLVYAILRSSFQIGAVLTVHEGLVGTLIANAFALAIAVLGATLLLGGIAALVEGLIVCLVYALSAWFNTQHSPRRAAWIGFFCAALPVVILVLFLRYQLGIYFRALWPTGFFFWLALPGLLLISTTTWLSSRQGGVAVSPQVATPGLH